MNWEPIDAAPKERNKSVLLYVPGMGVSEGWWVGGYDDFWEVPRSYNGDCVYPLGRKHGPYPTHWQPMPDKP